MKNIFEKAQQVRTKRAELAAQHPEGWLYLLTVPSDTRRGNVVMQVSVEDAAPLLLGGSHRTATPDEIAAFEAQQEAARKRIEATSISNKAHVLVLPARGKDTRK